MPRNKRHLEQGEKKQAILTAAAELFTENGFDGTSMNAIAKRAGITPNTIYWYFPGKDDVLIGVLNDLVRDGLTEAMRMADLPVKERLLHTIGVFERPESLMNTVHARVAHSKVIATWHARFHMMLEQILISEVCKVGIPPERAATVSRLLVYVIEGLISHPHQENDRHEMIDAMLELAGVDA